MIYRRILIALLLFVATPSLAQQPATALERCGSDVGHLAIKVNELAEQLDQANIKIGELQKQIEEAKATKPIEQKK